MSYGQDIKPFQRSRCSIQKNLKEILKAVVNLVTCIAFDTVVFKLGFFFVVFSFSVFLLSSFELAKVEEQQEVVTFLFEGSNNAHQTATSSSPSSGRSSSKQQRWIPPSIQLQNAKVDKNEITFSILNKLTPEKFEKLCNEIIHIGIDSRVVLKGIVILIYEKAVDELHYSSLYANLCRRLYHEAPNFDPPLQTGTGNPKLNSFRRLLIAKLQDEFENRNKKLETYVSKHGALPEEEDERRARAKQHMLGNIKFIGELYRLSIVQESILHQCIKQLINKKKKESVFGLSDDLECLCQIMTTCGRRLDHEKAKLLMDQYFDRMVYLHKKKELPSRVRFMLQDVIELRHNNWTPRMAKLHTTEKPKTLNEVRSDFGQYLPADVTSKQTSGSRSHDDHSNAGLGFFPTSKKQQYNDLNLHSPPSTFPSHTAEPTSPGPGFDFFSTLPATNHRPSNTNLFIPAFMDNGASNTYQPARFSGMQNGYGTDSSPPSCNPRFPSSSLPQRNQELVNKDSSSDLSPRFMKKYDEQNSNHVTAKQNLPALNQFLMRNGVASKSPAAYSAPVPSSRKQAMSFRPTPSSSKPAAGSTADAFQPPFHHLLDGSKKATSRRAGATSSQEKQKQKKNISVKEAKNMMGKIVEEFFSKAMTSSMVVNRMKELKAGRSHISLFCLLFLERSLTVPPSEQERACDALATLVKDRGATADHVIQGLKSLVEKFPELEANVPRIKTSTGYVLANLVAQDVVDIKLVAGCLEDGRLFPLFFLVLQQCVKIKNKEWLMEEFEKSGVKMKLMMPEVSRNSKSMREILEGKQLLFLLPLLRMETELSSELDRNPSPAVIYRWIKEHVDSVLHSSPNFIHILVTCCVNYVTSQNSLSEGTDRSKHAPRELQEEERKTLASIKPILQKFVHDSIPLQVHALYAVQHFCYSVQFPKGLLLRLFRLLYDEDVVDEEAYIKWKEDFNDDYPGKGEALFQVNAWLTWLQEADTEEDEDSA